MPLLLPGNQFKLPWFNINFAFRIRRTTVFIQMLLAHTFSHSRISNLIKLIFCYVRTNERLEIQISLTLKRLPLSFSYWNLLQIDLKAVAYGEHFLEVCSSTIFAAACGLDLLNKCVDVLESLMRLCEPTSSFFSGCLICYLIYLTLVLAFQLLLFPTFRFNFCCKTDF